MGSDPSRRRRGRAPARRARDPRAVAGALARSKQVAATVRPARWRRLCELAQPCPACRPTNDYALRLALRRAQLDHHGARRNAAAERCARRHLEAPGKAPSRIASKLRSPPARRGSCTPTPSWRRCGPPVVRGAEIIERLPGAAGQAWPTAAPIELRILLIVKLPRMYWPVLELAAQASGHHPGHAGAAMGRTVGQVVEPDRRAVVEQRRGWR